MNSNIWKDKSEKPKDNSNLVYLSINNTQHIGHCEENGQISMYDDNPYFGTMPEMKGWLDVKDLIESYESQSTRVEKLEKELADTQGGLCCGHCNKTAEASIIWANRLAKLEKALEVAISGITIIKLERQNFFDEMGYNISSKIDTVVLLNEITSITKGDNDE